MYCHFVPQTYQKSWHSVNGEKNVYYFDKNNYLEPLNENEAMGIHLNTVLKYSQR